MKIPLPPAAPEILASLALPFGVTPDPENTIEIPLESPWADVADIEAFIDQFYPASSIYEVRVQRVQSLGVARLVSAHLDYRSNMAVNPFHNTANYQALYLLDDILRGKQSVVYRDGRIDQIATDAAADARALIAADWREWLWSDLQRCQKYLDLYWKYYQLLQPAQPQEVDTNDCRLGPRPEQVRAAGLLSAGNRLLAAEVGFGKTLSVAIALQQGQWKKAIVVTSAGLVHSTLEEFRKAYPDFKGMVLSPSTVGDRTQIKNALIAFGRRKEGVVIMSHQAFRDCIPVHPVAEIAALEDEANLVRAALAEHDDFIQGNPYLSVPKWRLLDNLRKRLRGLEERVEKLRSQSVPRRCLTALGVDVVIADESDVYKNLAVRCRREITGIPTTGSALAADMYLKAIELHRTGGILGFLSGSWPDNSLAELWTAALYHDRDSLKALGLHMFDAWIGAFASVSQTRETDVSGNSCIRWRVREFLNFQLLLALKRFVCWGVAPVQGDRPQIYRVVIPCEGTPRQRDFLSSLSNKERVE